LATIPSKSLTGTELTGRVGGTAKRSDSEERIWIWSWCFVGSSVEGEDTEVYAGSHPDDGTGINHPDIEGEKPRKRP
jgi:hypothetical protein